MANQVYRGNSEQKLYQVINNFVGGMNTVDVDEVVAPNEFRELVNVDLSKYGMLQNRKGFALQKTFAEFIDGTVVEQVLSNKIHHVEVIQDDINFLETINKYETVATFTTDYNKTPFEFKLLVVTSNSFDLTFNYIRLRRYWSNISKRYVYEKSSSSLFTINGLVKEPSITGVKSVRLGNLIFMTLSDFIKHENKLVQIDVSDASPILKIIDNTQNYYETTPYDVETEGYNLLAANPILNVKRQGTLQNIRGITLIKQEGSNYYALDNIPTDGQFTALVMHTGDIAVSNVVVRVYYYNTLGTLVEYEQNKDYVMTFNDTLADGILTFDFDFAKIERRDVPIQIEFNVVDAGDISTYQTFADLNALNNYYNFTISTKNDNLAGAVVSYFYDSGMSPSEFHLWERLSPYSYNDLGRLYTGLQAPASIGEFTYYLEGSLVKKYYGTIFARMTYDGYDGVDYYQYNGSTWVADKTESEYNDATFKLQLLNNFDGVTIPGYPNTTTGIVSFLKDITQISNLPKRIPSNIVGVIMVGTTPYVWNDTFIGDETDFVAYEAADDATSNFTLVTQFGVTENLEPIKGLDLTDVKITSMNNNLVIYSGNTFWYSVEGNPNYFPYKNYVQLPLLGNDEIVSINYFRGTHMVFTKERIYRISGYFPDITVTLVNDSIGCLDAGSIRSFNNTLVFLTYDGLYRLKQNYYLEGLENVEKIDDKINNLFKRRGKFESILYKETYLLFVEGESFDTLKYYYNINLPNGYHPFTVDKYAIKPTNLFKVDGEMYSIKNGAFYKYDDGYTDFLPNVLAYTTNDYKESTYRVSIRTTNIMFGYPTHSKKFKNLIVKTVADIALPIYITVLIDDYIHSSPMSYVAVLNNEGQIEYREILGKTDVTTTGEQTSNLILGDVVEVIDPDKVLGAFILGKTTLGTNKINVHKMNISGKGRVVQFLIEQISPAFFGINDIGIQYKLGKVRGDFQ